MSELSIGDVKARWNDVLDALLARDRIAWLAFFDARIATVNSGTITINFADPQKLSGGHNFSLARKPNQIALLEKVLAEIFEQPLRIQEE